jgi:hypothetical protein
MNSRNLGGIVAAALLCLPTAALAGPRDDVLEALGKCAAIAADKDRLACYDALSPRVKDALAVPPATLAHEPTKEEQQSWFGFDFGGLFNSDGSPSQTTPQQFGSEQIAPAPAQPGEPPKAEEIESIAAGVTEYSFTPFGKFIVFLDNGQIWRQIEGDTDQAHFHRVAADNKVTISRGVFGSYNLQLNGGARIYKVNRVK